MKKIISLLSALAIFSTMAVTSFAATYAPSALAGENSVPVVEGVVEPELDSYGCAVLTFKLVNNETLSYSYNRGLYNSNGIDLITVTIELDEDVFDITDCWPAGHADLPAAAVAGGTDATGMANNTNVIVYNFKAQTIATYLTSLPEYLFNVSVKLKDGYTLENIPSDAVTYGESMVTYQKFNNSATRTNYTLYGVNSVSTFDYPLTVTFEGTAEDDEPTITPVDMVAGVDVTEGLYQGKTTISTPEAVVAADVATIEVSNDKSGEPQTAALPTLMGAGKTKVLTIIAFDKVAMAGSTFTIKYLNAASEAIKTFTYSVAE